MDSVLAQARRIQNSVMVDSCVIDRPTGTFNRETGVTETTYTPVWEGQCRVPRVDASNRTRPNAGTVTPASTVVIVPWNAEGIEAGDRVRFTESVSPGMTGRVLWVTDVSPRTFQSGAHLTCREVRDARRD